MIKKSLFLLITVALLSFVSCKPGVSDNYSIKLSQNVTNGITIDALGDTPTFTAELLYKGKALDTTESLLYAINVMSDDSSVATAQGVLGTFVLFGWKEGTTTITVMAMKGGETQPTATASFEVTVLDN